MQQIVRRPVVGGVAIAGASMMIAMSPTGGTALDVQQRPVRLTSGESDLIQDITIDFVRHGQSFDNLNNIIGTVAPGPTLTPEGYAEANAIAATLQQEYGSSIAGIYDSGLLRTEETAAPLAALLNMPVQDLSGLNEISAGILEGSQQNDLTGLLYLAAPLAWTLGFYSVPELGSSDYNGMAFESYFGDAVQTMYDGTISGGTGNTDIAFSSAAAIMTWTMMNVDNPDPLLMLEDPLTNTSQVVIQGNPTDGWTLISWDGMPVPEASLTTELFVDFRDLITAPQMASYEIWQALLTLDPTTISQAIDTGFENVSAAITQFPVAVIDDIVGAIGTGTQSVGADAFGSLSTELSTLLTDAMTSI
ncbi:phosphoglycerate mutase family protein [Candidatus Mycobacterium wuenschmannii]|uniref:Phosphoglycerate mutase family protein n=1 Tax=Candidatus Mycobacterium wuenschmannii TaxID=3027808 RepID=A0ABY8W194_9MYCO|nr:phosphoglycerate mutase family protein [Candidatus Mycobacterium wuenschmannii]WIM89645.1 phosphoglycerate mutase family protein [Candidatus Mycobacterium wuenschmannii]